jgi:ferrous iron transport protein B
VSVRIALAGNPNTGKSSLFNALTGIRQHVGNYPGITVERKEGALDLGGGAAVLVDLPGAYSLAAAAADERVVLDVLCGRVPGEARPALVVCVAEAANLRRNLFLASQIAETGLPMVLALNMSDEAERRGVRIDLPLLERRLGVPVVPTVAPKGIGVDALKAAVERALREPGRLPPVPWPEALRGIRDALPGTCEADRLRLLFDVEGADPAGVEARGRLAQAGIDPVGTEAVHRYAHLDALLEGVVSHVPVEAPARPYAVDRVLTHRVGGLLVFLSLMFLVFSSIYWLAQPLMDGIDGLFAGLSGWAGERLEPWPLLQSLVTKGVIAGVGGVVIFLPQILILFCFIAILEDSGYMARAAFLMDRVFAWTGLNGKSFVPMLSSFACAVPSILATRTIEDPKARLGTILVAPLMSCSARLPVYTLMIAAFVVPRFGAWWGGVLNFALYMLGLATALPVAFLVNRFIFRLRGLPFILEMPPYRMPRPGSVARRMWFSGKEFVVRAGTVIFAISIVIWALVSFPRPEELTRSVAAAQPADAPPEAVGRAVESAVLEQSVMGRLGRAVQPVFAPAGFDWRITVAVLSAFPAREVMVSTLGILFAEEEEDAIREKLAAAKRADGSPLFTPAVALAVMVFFAYCLQCGSTVAVMARESNWRWAGFAFAYMTGLAWLAAVATYQVGRWVGA